MCNIEKRSDLFLDSSLSSNNRSNQSALDKNAKVEENSLVKSLFFCRALDTFSGNPVNIAEPN